MELNLGVMGFGSQETIITFLLVEEKNDDTFDILYY